MSGDNVWVRWSKEGRQVAAIRRTAQRTVAGKVDAYEGASAVWGATWHLQRPYKALLPITELLDEMEVGNPSPARESQLKAEMVAVLRRFLDNDEFWA